MTMKANPLSFYHPYPSPPIYYIGGLRVELDGICSDFCMKVCRVQCDAVKRCKDPESQTYDAVERSDDVVGYMDISAGMIDRRSDDRHLIVAVTKDEILRYAERFDGNPVLNRLGYDNVTFYMLYHQPKGRIPLRREQGVTVDELRFWLIRKTDAPRNAEAGV